MKTLRLNRSDNIGIVCCDSGLQESELAVNNVVSKEYIPFANKIALRDIKAGSPIIKSGYHISYALQDIKSGSFVNERNTIHIEPVALKRLKYTAKREPDDIVRSEGQTFMGYKNPDGSVGTRNYLCVATTVQCVVGVLEQACKRINIEQYDNVDGIIPITHAYGCGVAINAPDANVPIQTIANITRNPNFGGRTVIVSLGCEKLTLQHLRLEEYRLIKLQDEEINDFQALVDNIANILHQELQELNRRKREPCSVASLCIGMQCGGSDAFSGLTANPILGRVSDMVIKAGGTSIFSEITEVRDAVELIADRCCTQEVHDKLVHSMSWYDSYLRRGGVDSKANTTPGNKAGGLSNIREKALGSIMKSGKTSIVDVIMPGERAAEKGLNFLAGPSSDFVCGTLLMTAGANLQLFSTGRGTPYSLEGLPTIKVSSNSNLANKWKSVIDFDAGRLLNGKSSFESMTREIMDLVISVASGEKTKAECNSTHNQLTLFNPAPIT